MKLILLTVSIFVLGSLAKPSTSVNDPLQRIQQDVQQLKTSNEETVAALKSTYDEKLRIQDEKIASLEQSGTCVLHVCLWKFFSEY